MGAIQEPKRRDTLVLSPVGKCVPEALPGQLADELIEIVIVLKSKPHAARVI